MDKDQKQFLISFLKGATLSCILSLALYFFFILATSFLLAELKGHLKDLICGVLLQISYIICIWWFHIRRDPYAPTETFALKNELRRYMREGGWLPAVVYGILAILSEVLRWFVPQNPITFIGVLNMPLMVIDVPVFGTVIAYTCTVLPFYALTLYVRKQKWKGDL